ncbi:MAG: hypothetical protein FWG36_08910, partial [Oscillospiraceae bacterium]|nr:hypothetical protein [Oscillospiraceae bacterium]
MEPRKWLIALFSDLETEMERTAQEEQIRHDLLTDTTELMKNPEFTPYYVSIDFEVKSIPVEKLRRNKFDYEHFFDYSVVPILNSFKTAEIYGLALLLDRELLKRHNVDDMYVPIIK